MYLFGIFGGVNCPFISSLLLDSFLSVRVAGSTLYLHTPVADAIKLNTNSIAALLAKVY